MSIVPARSAKSGPAKKSELKSTLKSTTAVPQYQPNDGGDSAGESAEQHASKSSAPEPKPEPLAAAPRPVSPHQRQGDRGSSDDAASRLPQFVRFADLRSAGIVSNWPQLYNLIDVCGFPEGVMLSPNARAWRVEDIERWLASRPTRRKKITGGFRRQQEQEVA
jgi:Prophage CP4-57 regulatory protein (AlpA)